MTVSVKVSVPEATELYVYTWLGWNVLCQVMLSQQIRVCVCVRVRTYAVCGVHQERLQGTKRMGRPVTVTPHS